jgi:aldose sugar dehydrogenase
VSGTTRRHRGSRSGWRRCCPASRWKRPPTFTALHLVERFTIVDADNIDYEATYALAFLPDGDLLITERPGRLRIVRKGVLDPQPIAGIPPVLQRCNGWC